MALIDTAAKTASMKNDFGTSHGSNAPSTWYIAIFSAANAELTGTGGISRIAVSNVDAQWTTSAGVTTNAATITSATSTGAWAAAGTQARLMDASTGGNAWDGGNLTSSVTVSAANTVVSFAAGAISIGA